MPRFIARPHSSVSSPSRRLMGSKSKMKPSQTGAARYGDGKTIGDSNKAAPATRPKAKGQRPNEWDPVFVCPLSSVPDLSSGLLRRHAMESPVSKIAGQMVANDHA